MMEPYIARLFRPYIVSETITSIEASRAKFGYFLLNVLPEKRLVEGQLSCL